MENLESLALKYLDGKLLVLDQRQLPITEHWVHCQTPAQMCHIIKTLQVRGAPLIGIAAALSLADFAIQGASVDDIVAAAVLLEKSRPTAVNLKLALNRLIPPGEINPDRIAQRAVELFKEDALLCDQMAEFGASLINDGDKLLTHCNTGSLVSTGVGTALGAIKVAWHQGKNIHVYVDETRPLMQGARLTTWELQREGIPYTLITDSMAATLMAAGKIDKVFLGSDRIALNGDFANKIGTYSVAVVANHHQIPFYVVAPYTTVDMACAGGADIPIEERAASEITGYGNVSSDRESARWAPAEAQVFNPAFDVTPVDLVTALILDSGIYHRQELKQGCLAKLKA